MHMLDKSTKKKENRMCKFAIKEACIGGGGGTNILYPFK